MLSTIDGGIAGLHHGAACLLRRRHPRVDLAGLQAGVHGVVVGELHRIAGAGCRRRRPPATVPCTTPMRCPAASLSKPCDRRAGRHDQREVAEVVAVGEPDGAPAGVGGGDRRRADVEAPRRHLGEQPGEVGADEVDLQAQLVGDRPQQFVVEAGEAPVEFDADGRRRLRAGCRRSGCRGVPRPSASMLTELNGSTSAVVYLSSSGGRRAVGQLRGAVEADARRSLPDGLHRLSVSAATHGAIRSQAVAQQRGSTAAAPASFDAADPHARSRHRHSASASLRS